MKTEHETEELALSVLQCLDMDAYELVGHVKDAIIAAEEHPKYEFDIRRVFHAKIKDKTIVDASGAFYAHFMNLDPEVRIDRPSEYRDHIPTTRFLVDSKQVEQLSTVIIGSSEMCAEVLFAMLAVPRNKEKLEALTEFTKPSFTEFKVPEPSDSFENYITTLEEFQAYVRDNKIFKEWENRG